MTPELVEHIRKSESFRANAYLDPLGILTIGYGRTHGVRRGDRTTRAAEERWMLDYLSLCSYHALTLSPILSDPAHPNRLAAIEDLIYNAGPGAYKKSTLRKLVNAGNWPAAAANARKWYWGTDRRTGEKIKLPGLVTRCEMRAQWLFPS